MPAVLTSAPLNTSSKTTLADLQQMLEEWDAIAQECDKARDQHE